MSAFDRFTQAFFLVGPKPARLSLREYLPNMNFLPLSVFLLDSNFINLVKFTIRYIFKSPKIQPREENMRFM